MSKMNNILILLAIALGITLCLLWSYNMSLSKERDRYRMNTEGLLSYMEQIQIDSAMMASTIQVLQLSLEDYEQYRTSDLATIKKMGVKIKDLEAAARHDIEVNATIDAEVKDSIIYRDTIPIFVRTVRMDTPFIQLNGTIENNQLSGELHLPVHLHQAVWIEYKHRFLWWRWKIKAIHQTIASDNPHVQIKYSEFINIKN